MVDLLSDVLSDPNPQPFASDSESAQRLAAMQRMFQRLGVLKSPGDGAAVPAPSPGPLDNLRPQRGLPPAFGGQLRPVNRSRFSPPPRMPDLNMEKASSSIPTEDLSQIAPMRPPSSKGDVQSILDRVGAIMDSLGTLPFDTEPRPTARGLVSRYRAPAMTPTAGPDTGAVDPNLTYSAGAPAGYFANLRGAESTNNPNAVNPITKASGLYQIQPTTWADIMREAPHLGLTREGILDPKQQDRAADYYTGKSLGILRPYLGRDPTKGELYALHLFGHSGGMNLLDNLDKAPIASVGRGPIKANPWVGDYSSGHALLARLEKMISGKRRNEDNE